MTNDKADFTQGSILKKLVAFMMPVLGALILQAAYGAVDLLVVGRFGSTSGLSAVSTGSQVLNLVTFVVIQFAMGITVLIARYLGEKRPEQIGAVIGGAAIVFTMISVGLFVVMVCFARPISVLMQAPVEAVDLTSSYVRICGSGIFFIVAYNLLSAIFRGLGGFFRLRRCLQDCKLCDAGTKCADAVHGIFCFPECRSGQDKTCETVHVYRNRRRTGCRLPGVPSCHVQGRYAGRIFLNRCSRYPEWI